VQAVVQGNCLEPVVHHPIDDIPNWLEEANAAIVPATFGDEESDDPPKLEGYLTFIPDGLDEPS
jgi:hypothetical protein